MDLALNLRCWNIINQPHSYPMKITTSLILLLFVFFYTDVLSQDTRYIIVLKNKDNSIYSLNNPGAYLSSKAIERRNRQNIITDSTDLPVNTAYIDSIKNAGAVTVLNVSKWLNQVLIKTTDTAALHKIQHFSFVTSTADVAPRSAVQKKNKQDKFNVRLTPAKRNSVIEGDNYFNYGNTYAQIDLHEGEFLHNKGFRGEGMTIAILDAGFYHYDTNPAFDSVLLNHQVLGTWDFVANKSSVTEEHTHGMLCFSTIAANRPGLIVGTAPKAKFYLFRTEDAATEYPVEEQNWVAAAERADSLGVDLISSSLGYSTFDNPSLSHTYADMNGHTTIITRGAELAVKKGIFVTNSAGNSGGDAWHYIIAPADAEHVMTVGSVNANGQVSGFSSYGPSSDGRIKPDVASMGSNTVVADTDGNPTNAYSGTSLSNPNLAGLITCLWQAFPEYTNAEIFDAVKKSANKFSSPDDRVGYGIPNMRIAYELLYSKKNQQSADHILGSDWLKAYPVPFVSSFNLLINPRSTGKATLVLYDAAGQKLLVRTADLQSGVYQYQAFNNLGSLAAGVYWLKFNDGKNTRIIRLLK